MIRSVVDGTLAFGLLFGLQFAVSRLRMVSPRMERLLESSPLLLVAHGVPIQPHLAAVRMTDHDLQAKLRAGGVRQLSRRARGYARDEWRRVDPADRRAGRRMAVRGRPRVGASGVRRVSCNGMISSRPIAAFMSHILALDQGTTSSRAVVYSGDGRVVASAISTN